MKHGHGFLPLSRMRRFNFFLDFAINYFTYIQTIKGINGSFELFQISVSTPLVFSADAGIEKRQFPIFSPGGYCQWTMRLSRRISSQHTWRRTNYPHLKDVAPIAKRLADFYKATKDKLNPENGGSTAPNPLEKRQRRIDLE